MGIAWHTFYRKGELINYIGKHHDGPVCLMLSHNYGGEMCGVVLLGDSEGSNATIVPQHRECYVFETIPFKNTCDTASNLNNFIDSHPLLNYVCELAGDIEEHIKSEGYVEFTPGEEPTPEQVVDSKLSNM